MNCAECPKLQKRIKVLQSDHEFELRKLNEDKAEQKALFELNLQKELRRWQQRYSKEKSQHEENSKKWISKIDQTTSKCQLAIQEVQKNCQDLMQRERTQAKNSLDAKTSQLKERYQCFAEQLKNSHKQELQTLENGYENKLLALQKRYERIIEILKFQATQTEGSLKKDYQSKITTLKNEKLAEQKLNAKLQQQNRRQRSKYLGEIYDNKMQISSLQQRIKTLKASIYAKEQQIARKQAQLAQSAENHKVQLYLAQKEQQKMKREFEQNLLMQAKAFYERELMITNKYEQTVKTIVEKRLYEQKLFQSNLQEVRSCVDNRPSRVEDVEEMLVIRDRLAKKEKEYQLLERQVRNYQLQLQNKEDTYNKLFIPSVNSTHLNDSNTKKKELRMKRVGKSVSTVRDILAAVSVQTSNNLPSLANIDKKMLPPRSVKIL